jgi:hypothetical protein
MSRFVAGLAAVVVFSSACGGSGPDDGGLPPAHPATRLAFGGPTQWMTGAGQVLWPVEVFVYDDRGALVTAPVEVTLTASAETLGGTTRQVSAGGIARFVDLSLTLAGSTTLVASAPGLVGAETAPLTVAAGPAASLAFDAQPAATTTAGATFPDIRVAAYDAYGNLATSTSFDVTLSVPGATLFGTTTRPLAAGTATFWGLSVRQPGTGYRLTAAGGPPPSVESTTFDVWPAPATRLVFAVQPATTVAGDLLTPAVEVRVEDAFGNVVPQAREVTIAPAAGLRGTPTVMTVGGVATFGDLSVTLAGPTTLTATAPGIGPTTSSQFAVVPAAPVSLVFAAQPPTSAVAGAAMPTVSVAAEDAFGTRCTNRGDLVGLTLDGAGLFGTTSSGLVSGVASFSGLSVQKAGTGYQLSALGVGLGPVKSSAFAVSPAAAHHLAFTAHPATSVAGAILPAVAVSALDAYGNVAAASGYVFLGFSAASSGFPTLFGTTTRPLVGGTALFDDLSIRKAGAGYRFAASGPVPNAASDTFDVVVGDATKLAFVVPPTSIRSDQAMSPPVQVAITDEWLNVAVTTERDVTLALEPNADGAVLAGTTTVATSGRVATFAGLTVHEPATGYRIRAAAPGLADAVSGTFNVTANWLSVGPDGGDITALAADPGASDVVYAATNGCVWKSTVGAASWTRACRGLAFPMQIDALVVHPSSSQKVFAATSGGLYRSNDAGASWSAIASLGAAAPYRTLAVAVAASGGIYAGTFDDGLWRSDDGGATWARLATGLPAKRITAIAIEPASTEVLYAAGVDPDEVGTVYRSVDRGETWTETALAPATFPGVKPTALLVDPSSADIIYVGAQSGLYESGDRGASFAQAVSGADVRDLAAHGPSRMRYAAGTTAIWLKQGGGQWVAVANGLPSTPKTVAVAVRTNGTAIAGTRYGPFDRTISGTTWTSRTIGLRAHDVTAVGAGSATVVYAATFGGGVFRSLDGGATWLRGAHPAENQRFYGIAVERTYPGRAWLAGTIGLYRTTDSGASWTEVLTAQGAIYSTLVDPSNDAIVYGGGSSDVFRSPNGGPASFRDLNVCAGPMRAMALSATAPLALWVGQDDGLCKVDLGGVSEIFVPYAFQPGTSGSVDAIAIHPDPALAGSTVWASTTDGFHTTLDGGATWTKTSGRFNALLAQPGKLYGARLLGAVELSRDGGATFAPVGTGLYHGNATSLAAPWWNLQEIYAGTSWGSVFKTTSGGE